MDNIKGELKELSIKNGAKLFGVCDLRQYEEEISEMYGRDYIHLPYAISIGIPYPKDIVNELEDGPTHTYMYYYKILNAKLDDIALQVALRIEELGFKTFPIPASQRIGDSRLGGIFSHRLGAHLSGIGWIGKNSSLITKEYGPRLRLVTILTDCKMEFDEPYKDNNCGNCNLCAQSCPSNAITGEPFNERDNITKRFIGERCDEHLSKVRTTFGKRICGKCLSACPYGKR